PTPTTVASPSASAKPSPPAPGEISLKVKNGTLITGLAARAKTALVAYGFKVPGQPGNTNRKDYLKTVIRYGAGLEQSAKVVAEAIPGAELREVDIEGIELILGSDQLKVRQQKANSPPTAKPSVTPTTKTAMQNICKK
ncbi:LytR C-terminal domain-containing protein, partial [Jiangella anatolica]